MRKMASSVVQSTWLGTWILWVPNPISQFLRGPAWQARGPAKGWFRRQQLLSRRGPKNGTGRTKANQCSSAKGRGGGKGLASANTLGTGVWAPIATIGAMRWSGVARLALKSDKRISPRRSSLSSASFDSSSPGLSLIRTSLNSLSSRSVECLFPRWKRASKGRASFHKVFQGSPNKRSSRSLSDTELVSDERKPLSFEVILSGKQERIATPSNCTELTKRELRDW